MSTNVPEDLHSDTTRRSCAKFTVRMGIFLLTVAVACIGFTAGPARGQGIVTVQPGASGNWTLTWPSTAGTQGYFLQTDGFGNTSWVEPGGSVLLSTLTASNSASLQFTGLS